MNIYLAARYSRRLELVAYADQLRAAGHVVTATWLDGTHQLLDDDPVDRAADFALADLKDLFAADVLISFTEAPREASTRGGRHVEFGIALAHRLAWAQAGEVRYRLYVVGPRENVFHWLPEVEHFERWEDCLAALPR